MNSNLSAVILPHAVDTILETIGAMELADPAAPARKGCFDVESLPR